MQLLDHIKNNLIIRITTSIKVISTIIIKSNKTIKTKKIINNYLKILTKNKYNFKISHNNFNNLYKEKIHNIQIIIIRLQLNNLFLHILIKILFLKRKLLIYESKSKYKSLKILDNYKNHFNCKIILNIVTTIIIIVR